MKFTLGFDIRRRNFIIRCCQAASAGLIAPKLSGLGSAVPKPDGEFHVHPQYRAQTPLDAVLLKTKAGSDDFINEKYHDRIAAILAEWSADLLHSPARIEAIEKVLAPGFSGSSLQPIESRLVRSGPALEIRRIAFAGESLAGRDALLAQLRQDLSSFSRLVKAEFQVTRIDFNSGVLRARVLYELVGTGADFFREQRTGFWDLAWKVNSSGECLLQNWRATEEMRSRSARPWYADVTARALGGNMSYSAQMLHGVDYWRTALDGACGIDIYGHNGVSAGDIDGDGFDDLYVCQPAGLPNRLFRNRGNGTFEDVTEGSGVGILDNTACALFADFDNDGRQDLVVVRSNGPLLFLNEGRGRFRRKPDAFQFAVTPQGAFTGAAAADYDRDGWLDIYLCLYVYYQGADQYKYPTPYHAAENGPPNFLMRNNGDGTFRDVTAESGLNVNNARYSFCCGWSDYNGDGWPDLYVVNDFGRKNLYRNNGDGTFKDVASQAGVEDVGAGMGVCWFDYNNDGAEDLYVADMWTAAGERIAAQDVFKETSSEHVRALYRKHASGNSLFRSDAGAFRDATNSARVGMGRWSWSTDAWDFDHDGFPDLYIANGMLSGSMREDLNSFFWREVVAKSPDEAKSSTDYEQGWNAINELIRSDYSWSGFERNVFYANNRDSTFSDVSGALGLDFVEDGRAFTLADFDHDGRQELILKNRNAPQLRVLKSVIDNLPPAVAFRLRGTQSNRDAIGAAVTLKTELGRQTRLLQAGSGFLSQHSKDLFFGLGDARGPISASVRWPSGGVQHFHDLPLNHRIWIVEGSESFRSEAFQMETGPREVTSSGQPEGEHLPNRVENWLLAPVAAPDFALPDLDGRNRTLSALRGRPVLLTFLTPSLPDYQECLTTLKQIHADPAEGLQLLTVTVDGSADTDLVGVYNILYRYLFDRHRDLSLPTSFLIDRKGDIVKIYQGRLNANALQEDVRRIPRSDVERLSRALPFTGIADTYEFGRNYLSYGSIYFQKGYLEQAEASFLLALHEDPSSAEAHYGLGSIYLKEEKTDKARDSFQNVVKLTASYPDTLPNGWNNLGLIAAREERTEEAIGYFQQALRVNPDHVVALENLGNAYRQLHQWEDAQRAFEHALALRPDNPEANYGLGMVFAQTDQPERALECLQKALQFRSAYPEALNNLGVLYLRTRRRDEAVASFEKCIRIAPSFDQAYLNLARVYVIEGDRERARTVLLELLKQHPSHVQAQKALDELR